MRYQLKEYHRPANWKEAHQLLSRQDVKTVPLFLSPRPQAPEDWPVQAVVDLTALDAVGIREEAGTLTIGLATSLQAIVESPLLKQRWQGLLNRCAGLSGTLGLRNYANLGGLLLDPAAPGEVAAMLLCLDTQVVFRSADGGLKPQALVDFLSGSAKLTPGEVAVSVVISTSTEGTLALERVGRTVRDIATVAVVTRLEVKAGATAVVRVAAFGAAPYVQRITPVESLLSGQTITPDLLDKTCSTAQDWAAPTGDIRGSAEYRKNMAGVLTRRALQSALHTNP
ncbi:MAG TPA: FAD binding domain-containing protein [Longilinea sp.]|nr:FAD binding domain-containing protein [Longilinea sp.]